jgi:quinoprotein relay system zinc metallohydrolase 1
METHADGYSDNLYRLLGDWMRGTEPVPPAGTIEPGAFAVGGRRFEALAFAGHTEADLAILDVETGTMIAGDLAFLDRAPTTPHADLDRWRESLDALATIAPAGIVPGHGPFDRTGESLRQTRAYLDWLDATLAEAAAQGLDRVETMRLPLPDAFAAMAVQPTEFERSVAHLFARYEEAATPLLD